MAEAESTPASSNEEARPPKQVIYCGICSLPPEYCTYGGTTKKCSEWLEQNHADLYKALYSADSAAEGLSTLSVDAQKRAERDAAKKAAKAEAAEQRETEKRAASRVLVRRVERSKRKCATEISGLDHFGLDLKKTAKELGKKFATGSSVTKNAAGTGEEITIQGDVGADVVDWISEHCPQVPDENVEMVEDKKKKNG
ncbi:translation machinery-associated protein 22 [Piedraia hortae CBS 480.64]|uniref:Translation machinery-associated protein 22 n=1 Tax=Piedraia hortae CBS 480.64 TaxID=1314780 RepID=A0A6A7BXH3_9PEZI|nr:translation machinery-associated protein 22 [Piedraia hortae CBS 480.64]